MYDILAAGMIRSGSTFIYQTLKALFPWRRVEKTHDFIPEIDFNIGVCTYRNFIDVTISTARTCLEDDNITDEVLEQAIAQTMLCVDIVKKYAKEGKALLLKYEEFVTDSKRLFDTLESHFEMTVDEVTRQRISCETSVKKNSEIAGRFTSFKQYDLNSHIHGKHICTPTPGEAQRLVRPELIVHLEEVFREDLKLFGYST